MPEANPLRYSMYGLWFHPFVTPPSPSSRYLVFGLTSLSLCHRSSAASAALFWSDRFAVSASTVYDLRSLWPCLRKRSSSADGATWGLSPASCVISLPTCLTSAHSRSWRFLARGSLVPVDLHAPFGQGVHLFAKNRVSSPPGAAFVFLGRQGAS